jgi:hypothetical protein
LTSAAQAATTASNVENQWWLICIHGETDIIAQPMERAAANHAFFEAWRQARKVKQAVPTIVRTASDRAEPNETPVILNHAAVIKEVPGGRN